MSPPPSMSKNNVNLRTIAHFAKKSKPRTTVRPRDYELRAYTSSLLRARASFSSSPSTTVVAVALLLPQQSPYLLIPSW